MSVIDVLVVMDDAQALRRHAHAVLGDPALRLAAAVRSARATIALLDVTTPDVLLIDPDRCGFDGIELVHHVTRHHPCCAVLAITRFSGDERGAAALAAGAAGCLPETLRPSGSRPVSTTSTPTARAPFSPCRDMGCRGFAARTRQLLLLPPLARG